MCTTCVPKNDVGCPGMRVKDSSKAPCGARNQIQAHGKNSECSWLPRHLSSTQFIILIPHIFRKTMPLMTLSETLRCCYFNQNFLSVPTRPPSSSFLVKGSRNDQNTTKSNDLHSESIKFENENKFLWKKHNWIKIVWGKHSASCLVGSSSGMTVLWRVHFSSSCLRSGVS